MWCNQAQASHSKTQQVTQAAQRICAHCARAVCALRRDGAIMVAHLRTRLLAISVPARRAHKVSTSLPMPKSQQGQRCHVCQIAK